MAAQEGEPKLYLSHTCDSKKNPLPYDQKLAYVDKAFGDRVEVVSSQAKTVIQALQELYDQGYENITYVGGEDRIGGEEDITKTIERYNGQPDKQGNLLYEFNEIKFVNAGVRNANSEDPIESASASKARELARQGDLEGFKAIVPFDGETASDLYTDVRLGLGINEGLNEATHDISGEVIINYLDGDKEVSKTYPLKDNNDVIMGAEHYYRDWANTEVINIIVGDQIYNNIIVEPYHNNRVQFKSTNPRRIFKGVQGQQSKGFESEKKAAFDQDTVNKLFEVIKSDIMSKNKKVADVKLIETKWADNPQKRNVGYDTLLTKSHLYKPGDEKEGATIADNIYKVAIEYKDGITESRDIYISNKFGLIHTPINAGINGLSLEEIINPLFFVEDLSSKEKDLLKTWWSTKSTRKNVAVIDEDGNTIIPWYYVFSDHVVKVDNIKNFIINQYASGYYYVVEDRKGNMTIRNIDDITAELWNTPVDGVYATITHSMLCINISLGDFYAEIDLRRKGAGNYSILSKHTSKPTVNRKGERIENLDNYKFTLVNAQEE